MTDSDLDNIREMQRIHKYIDKGKLDQTAWLNDLELNESLIKLLAEHKEYLNHM